MKNKKKFISAGLLIASGLLLTACSTNASAKPKTVSLNYSAAASLQPALTKIYKNYHLSHPNVKIDFDYGGSGALREKVIAGAPFDGVFLASKSDAQKLIQAKKAKDATAVLKNTLVLISNRNSTFTKEKELTTALKKANKIAIGEPKTVPAGMYAEETMTSLNLLASLKAKFVMGSDVTQVLSYVAAGNVDLGFVYQTDAMTNKNVKVIAKVPENLHDQIVYETAVVTASKQQKAVQNFNHYIEGTSAQAVFKQYGFSSGK